VAALFLILFFSQFKLVGGVMQGTAIDVCSGRGYKNETTGRCNCINNYHGYNCHLRLCPFGKSWHSTPTTNQERNREYVACSNAGDCDPYTGSCACRPGYEGRACQRLACAGLATYSFNTNSYTADTSGAGWHSYPYGFLDEFALNPAALSVDFSEPNRNNPGNYMFSASADSSSSYSLDNGVSVRPPYADSPGQIVPCSGHGLCRTMVEAGAGWNGLNLVQPPVAYANWEADSMQVSGGCAVCVVCAVCAVCCVLCVLCVLCAVCCVL
jgi:Laminin EGF domain